MIPGKFVEFLRGPYAMVLASRDANLFAVCTVAFGVAVDPDSDTVTVFVPDATAGPTYDNLAGTGRAALVLGHGEKHESYQFKGDFLRLRPTTEHEQAMQKAHRSRVIAHFRREIGERAEQYWTRFTLFPSTAVAIRVTDIYDQTPGPTAGQRLGL